MGWTLRHCVRGQSATWVPDAPCSATLRDHSGAEKVVDVRGVTLRILGHARCLFLRVRDGGEKRVIYAPGDGRWVFGEDRRFFIRPILRGDAFADEVLMGQPLPEFVPRKYVRAGREYPDERAQRAATMRARSRRFMARQGQIEPAAGDDNEIEPPSPDDTGEGV